eukprot:CAMPEP_0197600392 /NCGR_PEP_ID=MMETSP1326-20131121/33165_1 /TAXON_ID=1155430 /ORGANISM="Genus nov. species nov., Strain RCC2288" /LENGTH=362 /DNA_ID=CAMNT_0043167491 /DNA_START=237 /DNA_END=1322 /DNA_ORIENTATION=+
MIHKSGEFKHADGTRCTQSFAEYYETKYGLTVSPDLPMVAATFESHGHPKSLLKSLAQRIQESKALNHKKAPGTDTVLLPVDICESMCPADVWSDVLQLPSMMHRMESQLLALELARELVRRGSILVKAASADEEVEETSMVEEEEGGPSTNPSASSSVLATVESAPPPPPGVAPLALPGHQHLVSLLLEAITADSCMEDASYERLETLGDSFLKYASSASLFMLHPGWHEGRLTIERSRLVSNANLQTAAEASGLLPYLRYRRFQPGNVFGSSGNSSGDDLECLKPKARADVVEALIGAALVFGGEPAAFRMTHSLLGHSPAGRRAFPLLGLRPALLGFVAAQRACNEDRAIIAGGSYGGG